MRKLQNLHPKDVFTAVILLGTIVLIALGRDGIVHSIFETTVAVTLGEKLHAARKRNKGKK